MNTDKHDLLNGVPLTHSGSTLVPMTKADIAEAKRRAMKTLGVTLALVFTCVGCAYSFPEWFGTFVTVAFIAILYMIMFWQCEGADTFCLDKPLSGEACLRMRWLAERNPPIAKLVESVRECGREIAWADLWRANTWIFEQELAEQHLARLELNGRTVTNGL